MQWVESDIALIAFVAIMLALSLPFLTELKEL